MQEYKMVTALAGADFDEKVGSLVEDGYYVDQFQREGNHFYLLMHRYVSTDDDDDIEETAEEELWDELDNVLGRLAVLEGALALKIKKDSIDPAPKVKVESE